MAEVFEGACLCGSVRFRVRPPSLVGERQEVADPPATLGRPDAAQHQVGADHLGDGECLGRAKRVRHRVQTGDCQGLLPGRPGL